MIITQSALYILVLALGLAPFAWRLQTSRSFGIVSLVAVLVALTGIPLWTRHRAQAEPPNIPEVVEKQGYVSSDSCRSCHVEHYASWHRTFHRTMTQQASPATVVAPFDNVSLYSRGRTYLLEREGDKYFVSMADPDYELDQVFVVGSDLNKITNPPIVRREVVLTTGSHHMQGYWVNSRYGNKLFQVPWYYVFDEKQWIPREDCFLEAPGGPRHFKMWNLTCIFCHAVGGNPGLDPEEEIIRSEVADFGISCEACHGPGERHVRFHQNLLSRYSHRANDDPDKQDDTIVNPAKTTAATSVQICGQCHSFHDSIDPRRRLEKDFTDRYRPGERLDKTHRVIGFDDRHESPLTAEKVASAYWRDGACRVGGDEMNGVVASPCFKGGNFSCLSCHSMHGSDPDDQLRPDRLGNQACLPCHVEIGKEIQQHTHHAPTSSGSQCYNCHMPHTSYALFKAMRSHRIDSPNIAQSIASGRPNACNLCHLDKTLKWTDQHVVQWYGQPPSELTEEQSEVAASVLYLTKGHALQRTVAAWHMGWKPAQDVAGADWQPGLMSHLLEDPYSAVRAVTGRALRRIPGFESYRYDFVGSEPSRRDAKNEVLEIWQRRYQPRAARPAILMNADGTIDRERLDSLIRQRDDQPIFVPE